MNHVLHHALAKDLNLSMSMRICLPKALSYSKHKVEYNKEAKHYTFKLGYKVSNKGKHLNHLRWIIRNKSKCMPSQGQET